jgi:hypothetical protein
MHQDTPERRIFANTAKRIVEDLMRVEAGLRAMALLDAAGMTPRGKLRCKIPSADRRGH